MADHRHERIASRPGVMGGKPCVAGTRIPVYVVLQALAAERGFAGVREAYPSLTDEGIVGRPRLRRRLARGRAGHLR